MSAINTIPLDKLVRLGGTPRCPIIIDVRTDEDFAADPRRIPGAMRRQFRTVADWAPEFAGRSAVVVCQKGQQLSQGVASWLRPAGIPAEVLDGGAPAWARAGLPMVPEAKLPQRDARERTVWVPCDRPKVGRNPAPWPISSSVAPQAALLFF